MLLKIKKLTKLTVNPNPLSRLCFVFWNEQHAVLQDLSGIR
jgi:hypothetical protein